MVRRAALVALLALATAAGANRLTTFAWNAAPEWPAGTTVELCANGYCETGITDTQHTLDVPVEPGGVIRAAARAHADWQASDWAELALTWPADPIGVWVHRPAEEPIMATFETYSSAAINGTSLTISVPSSTQNGDLMIAAIISNNWNSLANVTAPAGWTLIGSTVMPGGAAPRLAVYSRIASSEPASYAWTSGGTRMTGVIARFSGVDGTTPVESYSNTAYVTSNTTVRSAAVTTTDANQTVVNIAGSFLSTDVVTYTPPTDYTEHVDYSGGTDVGRSYIEFSSRVISSAGSTGDIDATASATLTDKHGIALVINDAAATASIVPILMRQYASQWK